MKRFVRILRKIFFLPPLPTVLIAAFGYAFVLAVAVFNIEIPAVKYLSYISSAYALTITITGFRPICRAVKRGIKENPLTLKLMKIPPVKRYFDDHIFKARVSLYLGLMINLAYIFMKLISGIYYRSLWLIALAVYYILLAVMRIFLVGYDIRHSFGENILSELRRYRLIGILLLVMNLSLTVIVLLVVHQNKGFEYPGLLIYAMAMYAFYSAVLAIINIVRAGRHGSPAVSAAKAINLVAAMVSMLSLTTAMLAQFGGENDPEFRRIMTGAVGGGVCVLVLGMAAFMIWKSTKRIRYMNMKGETKNG